MGEIVHPVRRVLRQNGVCVRRSRDSGLSDDHRWRASPRTMETQAALGNKNPPLDGTAYPDGANIRHNKKSWNQKETVDEPQDSCRLDQEDKN